MQILGTQLYILKFEGRFGVKYVSCVYKVKNYVAVGVLDTSSLQHKDVYNRELRVPGNALVKVSS